MAMSSILSNLGGFIGKISSSFTVMVWRECRFTVIKKAMQMAVKFISQILSKYLLYPLCHPEFALWLCHLPDS